MADFKELRWNGTPVHSPGSQSVMAFLQARMGSHRLPGKVLMRIHRQSILERAVRRLQASPVIDEVAVLTTCRKEDDAIVEECRRMNVLVYRGPEEDVLLRFYEASRILQPEIIIRATADNPLIEIESADRIVAALRSMELDLCIEQGLPYGAATEAITATALEKTHFKASDPRHREHVTLYPWEHPEEFRVAHIIAPDFVRYPEIRVTVDTPEDFLYVERLVGRVAEEETPLQLREYLAKALEDSRERELRQ
jgi:spore coat polysaccharide biosynthesis protein SpsF